MTRRNAPRLVDPMAAHMAEQLRALGVPTGKERTLSDLRQRRADDEAFKPRLVEGNLMDGTGLKALLQREEDNGRIIDRTVEGEDFGRVLYHPILVSPVTPFVDQFATVGSTTASTTSTVTTSQAILLPVVLASGIWSILVVFDVNLKHSASGNARLGLDLDGVETVGGVHVGISATAWDRRCHTLISTDLQGDQTVNVRGKFRPDNAGTVSATGPRLIVHVWRTE